MEPSLLAENIGRALWDVLSFRTLLSPTLLIVIYYLGAIGIPFLVWKIVRPVKSRVRNMELPRVELPETPLDQWLPTPARLLAYGLGVFLLMELCWRLLFEFMLAYFQMHEYLASMQAG